MLARNTSCACRSHMDDKFRSVGTEVRVESRQSLYSEAQVPPSNGLTAVPYEFVIEPLEDTFVALSTLALHVRLQITKGDGSAVPAGAKVAPVNDALASLWESAQVRINDHEFNPETGLFPSYKSYISKLLSFNNGAAPQLAASGFYPPDENTAGNGINTAYTALMNKTAESAEATFSGPLPFLDVLSLDNHLSPQTKLSISLFPSSPEFFLHAGPVGGVPATAASYKYKIRECFLQFRRLALPSPATEKILKRASEAPQRYIAPYTELKAMEVPPNLTSWTLNVYPSGHVLPKQLIVAQVKSVTPEMGRNPYIFGHHKLRYLAPALDEVVQPNVALEPDFEKALLATDYYNLFAETGKRNSLSQANLVSYESFANGSNTLFPIDLTPDKCNGAHAHARRTAKLDLHLRWAEALAKPVTVLVYAIFDQVITVDPRTGRPSSHVF